MNLTSSHRARTDDSAHSAHSGDRTTGVLFAAAPALFLGGWLLMRPIDGQSEPGGWWTAAHAVWLAGFVLFAAMSMCFRRTAGAWTTGRRITVNASAAIVLFGALANIVQLSVDLVGGFRSANSAELQEVFADVKDIPGADVVVYGIGAQIIFIGLVAFAITVALARRGTGGLTGTAALVTAGTVVMAVGIGFGRDHWTVPVGMACLLAGLTLLGRRLDVPAPRIRTAVPAPRPTMV